MKASRVVFRVGCTWTPKVGKMIAEDLFEIAQRQLFYIASFRQRSGVGEFEV